MRFWVTGIGRALFRNGFKDSFVICHELLGAVLILLLIYDIREETRYLFID